MPRRLGQHFLYQEAILERIASSACEDQAETVIEIGPGPGTLTAHLLPRAGRLIAAELDAGLAQRLRERYSSDTRFTLIEGDVLQQDLRPFTPAVVCGNIPYYITSPIIEKSLELGAGLVRAVFLIQKEVADRLCAGPGTRDYGYLTVVTQAQCDVERLFLVRPASFRPPPKVDSAVIRLAPLARPLCADLPAFRRFAGACFRQKRKTLRNNLAGIAPREVVDALPEASMRAEQLPVQQLVALFHRLASERGR